MGLKKSAPSPIPITSSGFLPDPRGFYITVYKTKIKKTHFNSTFLHSDLLFIFYFYEKARGGFWSITALLILRI